jgi:protein-tyrosine sulfotransferase
MIVYYEQLVLHPRRWITIILDFLDLPFDESVMHHQVQLSRKERIRDFFEKMTEHFLFSKLSL